MAAMGAAAVTCALFLLMSQLITAGPNPATTPEAMAAVRFSVDAIPDPAVARDRIRPLPPREVPDPPPQLPLLSYRQSAPAMDLSNMSQADLPEPEVPLIGEEDLFMADFRLADGSAAGEVIPVVIIQPTYPREAVLSGTEGWVRVEFTITASGTVTDARVIDAQPPQLFNREAIRAIRQWKFKPRVVDGAAVARRATQLIDFRLEDSAM